MGPGPAPHRGGRPCAVSARVPRPIRAAPVPPLPPPVGRPAKGMGRRAFLHPGGGWGGLRPPGISRRPRGKKKYHTQARPGKGQDKRPKAALAWLSCLRSQVSRSPKGGLTSSNTCATMMEQGRPALYRQPFGCPLAVVEGGRFFSPPPPVPPPSGGGAQGHGDATHPPPSATGGDEGTKRGVRTTLSAPLWRILCSRSHSTKRQVILLSSFSKFIAAPSRGRL